MKRFSGGEIIKASLGKVADASFRDKGHIISEISLTRLTI
jgi:hypothetical protein